MPKSPRAENLIQLMEWLKLGKRFHIHREFLKYLKMTDIIRLCLVSNHYKKKYLNYCYNYFLSSSCSILHIIKNNANLNFYPKKTVQEKINKTFSIVHQDIYIREFYYNYLELKKLYGKNDKVTKMVEKYFENVSV